MKLFYKKRLVFKYHNYRVKEEEKKKEKTIFNDSQPRYYKRKKKQKQAVICSRSRSPSKISRVFKNYFKL